MKSVVQHQKSTLKKLDEREAFVKTKPNLQRLIPVILNFQVKIWFQNRRMKWKRSKKAASESSSSNSLSKKPSNCFPQKKIPQDLPKDSPNDSRLPASLQLLQNHAVVTCSGLNLVLPPSASVTAPDTSKYLLSSGATTVKCLQQQRRIRGETVVGESIYRPYVNWIKIYISLSLGWVPE